MTLGSRKALATAAAVVAFATGPASADLATVLVRSGGPLNGTPYTVQTVHWLRLNGSGGYVVHVTTTDGVDRIWGAPFGGPPSVIRSVPVGSSIDPGVTLGEDGSLLYVLDGPDTGDRSVQRDDTVLAVNGGAYPPIPGSTWTGSQFRAVALPGTGPIWCGLLAPTSLYGLFGEPLQGPFLLAGETVPGIPQPIGNPRWNTFRFSPSGLHSCGIVNVTGGELEAFVIDRECATAAGTPLRHGQVIPPELGGNGSAVFGGFIAGDINDGGAWVGGYFDQVPPESPGALGGLLESGVLIRSPGDVLDGVLLRGGPHPGMRINSDADILAGWVTGTSEWNQFGQALGLRHGATERLVLRTHDEVDLDGDLVAEPGAEFFRLWYDENYPSNLELSGRDAGGGVTIFAKAWVDTAGTTQYPWLITDDIVAILRIDSGAAVAAPVAAGPARRGLEVGPSPTSDATEFVISLDRPEPVELSIYDVRGVRVARLLDEVRAAGVHRVRWSPANAATASSGVLFYRARLGDAEYRGKLVRVR